MAASHGITDADLIRLGFDPTDACPDIHIIARDEPEEGRGATATPLAERLHEGVRTREEPAPELERRGVQIERCVDSVHRTVWRLSAEATIEWVGDIPTGAVSRDGVIYIDSTQMNGYYSLSLPSRGLGLVIRAEGGSDLHLRCGRLQPRPDLRALARETGDPWLLSEVEERLPQDGDSFGFAVAAGFLSRMRIDPPAQRRERTRVLLEGGYDAKLDPERAWARTLSRHQAQELEDAALAWVDRLAGELSDVGNEVDSEDPSWHACMRRVVVGRDDLEGLVILLEEAGAGARLRGALARFDREGEVQIRALPSVDLTGVGELVRRALLLDPAAWWTRPLLRGQ